MTAHPAPTAPPFDPVTYEAPDGVIWTHTAGLDVWSTRDGYLTSEELRIRYPAAQI